MPKQKKPALSNRLFAVHLRHFVHFALFVIGNPLASLPAGFKMPGAHAAAIPASRTGRFVKPLPIPMHLAVLHTAPGPQRAIFVIVGVFGDHVYAIT